MESPYRESQSGIDANHVNVRIKDPVEADSDTNICDGNVSSPESDDSSSSSPAASYKKNRPKKVAVVAMQKKTVNNKKTDLTEKELRQQHHDAMDKKILEHFTLDCSDCSYSSTTFLNFATHCQQIHNKRGFVYCCNKKFSIRSKMLDHISLHSNPESFKYDK